jgi:hypothetical protein
MRRRTLLPLVGSAAVFGVRFGADAEAMADGTTLASAPIEVTGDWAGSLPRSALTVVSRTREVSLAGVRLLSDRQPGALRVENHTSGPPHIWLHFDGTPIAWIVVDIGPRDWSKLAYQFGHELGHVVCNSWGPDAKPADPCQWLEEALVESFSIRGLGLLADSWERDPPFPGNAAFGAAIRQYREDVLTRYRAVASEQGADRGLAAWFAAQRAALESNGGVGGPARAAMPTVLAELEADPDSLGGLGALNRWPGRTGVPMEEYLRLWKKSCAEIGASQRLPIRVRKLLLSRTAELNGRRE